MTSSCNVKKKEEENMTFNGKQRNIYIDKIFKKFKKNEKEYVL